MDNDSTVQHTTDIVMSPEELLESSFDTDVSEIEERDNLTWVLWGPQWVAVTS